MLSKKILVKLLLFLTIAVLLSSATSLKKHQLKRKSKTQSSTELSTLLKTDTSDLNSCLTIANTNWAKYTQSIAQTNSYCSVASFLDQCRTLIRNAMSTSSSSATTNGKFKSIANDKVNDKKATPSWSLSSSSSSSSSLNQTYTTVLQLFNTIITFLVTGRNCSVS